MKEMIKRIRQDIYQDKRWKDRKGEITMIKACALAGLDPSVLGYLFIFILIII